MTSSDDFLWGSATAAYQIEGATSADGRGRSIWDTYAATPGRIARGETGDVAADHYHLWERDLDLMAELGLRAYRFSIAWPRVLPQGRGRINQPGIDFYSRLVDGLLERGVVPVPTLYHWDLPQALEDAGGWPNRDTTEAFAEFTAVVAAALGDRVSRWITVNEPWCAAFLGYGSGVHAPGRIDPSAAVRAGHHLNVAHSKALTVLRTSGFALDWVGAALNLRAVHAADPDDPGDVRAAGKILAMGNDFFAGPMLEGDYGSDVLAITEAHVDWDRLLQPGDLTSTGGRMDVLGVNYYSSMTAAERLPDSPRGGTGHENSGFTPWVGCDDVVIAEPTPPLTDMGWNIDPAAFEELLVRTGQRYAIPLIITENGLASPDEVDAEGRVADPDRIAYLKSHLAAAARAQQAGVDLRGYFVWSFMDNFEWARGYSKRFGIVHVDYETKVRTPKDSARWYARTVVPSAGPGELLSRGHLD